MNYETDAKRAAPYANRPAASRIRKGGVVALMLATGAFGACGDSKSTPDVGVGDIIEDVIVVVDTDMDTTPLDVPVDTTLVDTTPVDVGAETTPSWAAVVLNEIAPSGDPSDWIELFNPTAAAADLSGWLLTDSDPLHTYVFAAGTSLAPGAWLVVDKGTEGFDFGLGAGDGARLVAPDGTVIDATEWTPETLPRIATLGRFPNGTGPFMPLYIKTRGATNVENPDTVCGDETAASPEVCDTNDFSGDTCAARGWAGGDLACVDECTRVDPTGCTPRAPGLVLNEVTSSGDDRIELFNGTGATIDLEGWSLGDEGGGLWTMPAATSIDAGAYLVFVKDVHHTFGLGGSDAVELKNASGDLVDSARWASGAAAVSFCRRPNGVGGFEPCPSASFGGENF